MEDTRPAVCVVVPTRDRPDQLRACVDSVCSALQPTDELLIVDSASRDAAAVRRVASDSGARLVRCERPGVNIARNAGWRATTRDVVVFTDDDVVVDIGWADALARAAAGDPAVGFVTGRVLPPPGTQPSRDVAIKAETAPASFGRDSVGNLGHSASLALPRSVLDQIGGFDDALGVGGRFRSAPETDLYDRCFAAGYSGRYEPAALAYHAQWRGPRRLLLLEARYGFGNGARLAKLLRTDRRRCRIAARDALSGWGFKELQRELRLGHGYPALGVVVRLAATVAGFARAVGVPVRDGHFAPRGQR